MLLKEIFKVTYKDGDDQRREHVPLSDTSLPTANTDSTLGEAWHSLRGSGTLPPSKNGALYLYPVFIIDCKFSLSLSPSIYIYYIG
jgi:hypothetical protein